MPSTDQWINNVVYPQNVILFHHKKKWSPETVYKVDEHQNTMLNERPRHKGSCILCGIGKWVGHRWALWEGRWSPWEGGGHTVREGGHTKRDHTILVRSKWKAQKTVYNLESTVWLR